MSSFAAISSASRSTAGRRKSGVCSSLPVPPRPQNERLASCSASFSENEPRALIVGLLLRVGESAPRRAHGERRDAREIALGVAGVVELGDRVRHFGLTGDADVQRRQHLSGDAQRRRLGERRDAVVVLQLELPGRVLYRAHELGRAEVTVANDDRMAEFVVARAAARRARAGRCACAARRRR